MRVAEVLALIPAVQEGQMFSFTTLLSHQVFSCEGFGDIVGFLETNKIAHETKNMLGGPAPKKLLTKISSNLANN